MSLLTSLLLPFLLAGETAKPEIAPALKAAGIENVKTSDWNGYQRFDFQLPVDRAGCIVVAPKEPAKGNPWIWRARFFGHQPALDLQLLDRGFHLTYCDVSNLYGSPVAVERSGQIPRFRHRTSRPLPKTRPRRHVPRWPHHL